MAVKEYKEFTPECVFVDDSIAKMCATESVSTVMDINGEPMKVFICTDDVIAENHLKPVTNSISFSKGNEPTPDGIFSEVIFGTTQSEKILNHAYIDLKHKFFHPYVYEILKSLHSKIPEVLTGEKVWTIKEGKLVEVSDETSPLYNPNNTGLEYIIKHFRELKFEKNDSILHNDKIKFFKVLTDKEIFITKFLVIPRFYRDYTVNGRMKSVDPINNMYTRLIGMCNSLESGIVGYTSHKTMMAIQEQMVTIRKYGQQLIEKKEGLIHRSILGRNTTFGARGVISVPSLVGCDYPDDCQVDMIHTGLPLSKCIEGGYPFILKWLLDWVEREVSGGAIEVYAKNEQGVYQAEEIRIKNHVNIFNEKYINKRLQMFRYGYGGRWEPIKLETEDGRQVYCRFHGQIMPGKDYNRAESTIVDRPLTWCDLIYMSAEDTLSDKHIYSTRYPVEDYFNIIPTRVAVLSTLKTAPMMVNGKLYKHYPVINPFENEVNVSRSFIDTIMPSNLHLQGYGGDYDGDTVSFRIVFSQEANTEAEEKIFAITNYITINGSLIRKLGNESTLCIYNMTRRREVS